MIEAKWLEVGTGGFFITNSSPKRRVSERQRAVGASSFKFGARCIVDPDENRMGINQSESSTLTQRESRSI